MTIREAMNLGRQKLAESGVPDAGTDADYLLAKVCGFSRWELVLNAQTELKPKQEQLFSSLLFSRMKRIPLQYLLGEESFYGLKLHVDEHVLIPRPETELLCETALSLLKGKNNPRVLDLCTGSGAIALAISSERPDASVYASDISRDALLLARQNGEALGLSVNWLESDLFEQIPEIRFDAIVSNPPYIPTDACRHLQEEVLYEPLSALDGGTDGLDFYRRIINQAPFYLQSGAYLLMECGSEQAEVISELLRQRGFSDVAVQNDLNHLPRMVIACWKEEKHAAV